MPKNRSKNADEYHRGIIRELQKENRHLKKRVRQLEKAEHMFEDALLSDGPLEFEVTEKQRTCEHCGKGRLDEINVLDRIFEQCNTCDYRKKIGGP